MCSARRFRANWRGSCGSAKKMARGGLRFLENRDTLLNVDFVSDAMSGDERQRRVPVAQPDRAFDYESKGREFESLRARHVIPGVAELADAHDSKSCGKPCRFESGLRDQRLTGRPCGAIAQLGERQNRTLEASGSNPLSSTTFLDSSAVEHPAVNRRVVGSNPTRGAISLSVKRGNLHMWIPAVEMGG